MKGHRTVTTATMEHNGSSCLQGTRSGCKNTFL